MLMKHLGQDMLAILCGMGTVAVLGSVMQQRPRPAKPMPRPVSPPAIQEPPAEQSKPAHRPGQHRRKKQHANM